MKYDFALIGGGIIGLATALELTRRFPGAGVLVLEKEDRWAAHQSGRNSGVLHSGIYYRSDSLKAQLCRAGHRSMVEFCREHGIPHELCGKVIVATQPEELPVLAELERRGAANGVDVRRVGPARLRELEPHAAGIAALWVPAAGVVDFGLVTETFARLLADRGAELRLRAEARALSVDPGGVTIESTRGTFQSRFLINCAGLQSDRIAALMGEAPPARIVPFRGEYYSLVPERADLVRSLLYPVPDPSLPFLGVHFTRGIDGSVHAGPNAVLCLKREGYRRRDVDLRYVVEVVSYRGFQRLLRQYWRVGAAELVRSVRKKTFVRSLQRLVPEIRTEDLIPGGSGVRAQAVSPDGRLVDDFLFVEGRCSVHVCNAPSPAATTALPIAQVIVERVARAFRPRSVPRLEGSTARSAGS